MIKLKREGKEELLVSEEFQIFDVEEIRKTENLHQKTTVVVVAGKIPQMGAKISGWKFEKKDNISIISKQHPQDIYLAITKGKTGNFQGRKLAITILPKLPKWISSVKRHIDVTYSMTW